MQNTNNILEIKNLKVHFEIDANLLDIESESSRINFFAVDDVSFEIKENETLGIVGESGSGKSVTAFSILRLIPSPPGFISGGKILFGGKDLLLASDNEMHNIRGKLISIVPQEPFSSLNPVMSIGEQISDAISEHNPDLSADEIKEKAIDILKQTEIHDAEKSFFLYPHQFSGGMLQRVVIAIAIVNQPVLLIADEPTTSLDSITQENILNLIHKIKESTSSSSLLLISHDLRVIKKYCDRVIVMYAGMIQETGAVNEIYYSPKHPYTKGLIESLTFTKDENGNLKYIKGNVPGFHTHKDECSFAPRCPFASDKCFNELPDLKNISETQSVRCHLYND